jgi:hypothetical protein
MARVKVSAPPKPRKRAPARKGFRKNTTEARADHTLTLPDEQVEDPGAWVCQACGQPMVAQGFTPRGEGSGVRGRLRKYDLDACRECVAAWSTFAKMMVVVRDRATPKAWLMWRQLMMKLANSRAWNRGVANQYFQEARGQVERRDVSTHEARVQRAQALIDQLTETARLSVSDLAATMVGEYAAMDAYAKDDRTSRDYFDYGKAGTGTYMSREEAAQRCRVIRAKAQARHFLVPHQLAGARSQLALAKRALKKAMKG